ncbi:hypothetical protein [Methylobacterium hispanicum]|uniref:hypothetical protein n=1 Tax=Methylobacterium hispanicum TaxID=270350 RepID=UPI002F2C4A0C
MRLVLIEWVDSAQPVAAWRFLEDIDAAPAHRCQTVGHLIHDGDEAKVVALSVATVDGTGAWGQAAGVTTIPTRSVLRLVDLIPASAETSAPGVPADPGTA